MSQQYLNPFEECEGNQWVSTGAIRSDLVDEARWAMRRIVEGRALCSDAALVAGYAAWAGSLPTPAPTVCPECDGSGVWTLDPCGPGPAYESCPRCGGKG